MDQDLRRHQTEFAQSFNLSLEEYLQVVRSCNSREVVIVLELMKSKKPKSGYRSFCQSKVRRWLEFNRPGKPLTEQDFKYLEPKYPVTWSLPR